MAAELGRDELGRGGLSRAGFLRLAGGAALGVAVPGVLAACGGSGSASSGTLRVVGVADEKAPLDQLTAAYHKAHSGISFKTSYAPVDQVQTSVRAQLGAGNAPDLHVVYPGDGSSMSMTQIAKAGLLADLSSQSWTSLVPASFKPAFQNNGKTYLYSAGSSVIGAIYNKKVFQDAGVSIPTTWTEVLAACAKLKAAGKIPIALGAQTPWVTQLISYALVASTVYAKDPTFDDKQRAGKASFVDSGWRQAFEMYMSLRDKGFFNSSPTGTTYEQSTAMVANGEAGMAVQVSAVLSAFRAAASDASQLSMFPFPGADTASDVLIPAGVVVGLGVHSRSKNLAAAKAFIEYLGKQENINAWAKSIAAIPLHQDASSSIDPALTPFLPFTKAGKAVPFMDQRWPNAEVQPTHFAVVQELLAKQTSIDAALKKMDSVYRKGE